MKTYTPEHKLDVERIELFEATLGPLIDRHLRWQPEESSPTATVNTNDYGYMPLRFTADEQKENGEVSYRPGQEPLNFRLIAGQVLGMDSEHLDFENTVREIDGHADLSDTRVGNVTDGWYRFLIRSGLEKNSVVAMKEISEIAFCTSAHTEDNVPAYTLETMGRVRILEAKYGLKLPAHEEWYRGLWTAEEDAHKEGQNDYGTIRRLTTNMLHKLSKNSQLRVGTAVDTSNITSMGIYTTIQEYSTRLAHKRNAVLFGPVGYRLQEEESQDETRHYDLYGGLIRAAYQDERFTEEVITLFHLQDNSFNMPGLEGIANFGRKAATVARAKIYGIDEEKEAKKMAMKRIGMLEKGTDGSYINPLHISEHAQSLLDSLRSVYDTEIISKVRRGKFILGQTITIPELRKLHKSYVAEKDLPILNNKRIQLL
jgi:hypothetical protein